jgi:hypothetical protein
MSMQGSEMKVWRKASKTGTLGAIGLAGLLACGAAQATADCQLRFQSDDDGRAAGYGSR